MHTLGAIKEQRIEGPSLVKDLTVERTVPAFTRR